MSVSRSADPYTAGRQDAESDLCHGLAFAAKVAKSVTEPDFEPEYVRGYTETVDKRTQPERNPMTSMQSKVLGALADIAKSAELDYVTAEKWANTGIVYLQHGWTTEVAVAYDFQPEVFSLAVSTDGSQPQQHVGDAKKFYVRNHDGAKVAAALGYIAAAATVARHLADTLTDPEYTVAEYVSEAWPNRHEGSDDLAAALEVLHEAAE